MTEREKCGNGLWYDANNDSELLHLREEADALCHSFNSLSPKQHEEKEKILESLLPHRGKNTVILQPFFADYGFNCFIGDGSFINRNAYFMDCAPIRIGFSCFIGPNCGIYTASHPLLAEERNSGLEKAEPVTVGNNVWIGGNVTILGGVSIGDNAVIGAGSVVTKDVPPCVVAAGNPCRVLRAITAEDSVQTETGTCTW